MAGGQPTPPILVEAFAINAPAGSAAGDKTFPFPSASQIGVTPGAASLNDGFPPLTMTAPGAGGVPPFGTDFNGILYILSAQIAALAAGQLPVFSATLATAMSGYAAGALLASAVTPGVRFTNLVAGNSNDPDSVPTGWRSSRVAHASTAPSAGTHADTVLPGLNDYVFDIDTTAGAILLNGFVAQVDGQKLVICCTGANPLTIGALAGGAGNQVRLNSSITILQNDSLSIQYNSAITAWVQV
jgi:hypothetical protein